MEPSGTSRQERDTEDARLLAQQPVAARVANEFELNVPLLRQGSEQIPRDFSHILRVVAQASCAFVLVLCCCGSATMILSEAVQGVQRSFFCHLGKHERRAPLYCALPLAAAALLCNLAVVVGLGFIGHFACRAGMRALQGSVWHPEDQRAMLRANLKIWRTATNNVLLGAASVYLLAGPPCAGLARMAFIFLATGFLTLYATMLFFDDDADQAPMPPRFLRFLGVYMLIGFTFTAYSWGFLERLGLDDSHDNFNITNVTVQIWSDSNTSRGPRHKSSSAVACTAAGRSHLSPSRCTVPLDFASGVSLWWVASPLFASLLSSAGTLRKFLQRWRRRVDLVIVLGIFLLTITLRDRCRLSSPVAFGFAELGACSVFVLLLLRLLHPTVCDAWRGPLEHLVEQVQIKSPADIVVEDEQQCAICLADLQGQVVCRAPCGHDFHMDCLEEWVTLCRSRAPGCPLCRESLQIPQAGPC